MLLLYIYIYIEVEGWSCGRGVNGWRDPRSRRGGKVVSPCDVLGIVCFAGAGMAASGNGDVGRSGMLGGKGAWEL